MAYLFDIKTWMAIAIAALTALVGLQQIRVSNAKAATASVRAELASDRATYAQAAQKAEQAARAEETRRTAATQKVIQDAKLETSAAQTAANDAVRAADGLRKRVAASSPPVVMPPAIPALPDEARVTKVATPSICLQGCSRGLTMLRAELLPTPTSSGLPAKPAKDTPTSYSLGDRMPRR